MTAAFPLAVAIEFAYALWDDVAAQIGVRYVAIKGIGAQLQGVQPPRTPSDIDVLVSPEDFEASCSALMARGWRQRPADTDEWVFPRHSSSYYHEGWPCDIDLHFRFPGLEADAAVVFETLWRDHDCFLQSGHSIPRPASDAAVIIAAVHFLRSPWVARHRTEYDKLVQATRNRDRDRLIAVGSDLGALACARPFYQAAFGLSEPNWGQPSREWELRTVLASPNSRRMAILLDGTWHQRYRMLSTAIFPDRGTLRKTDIGLELEGLGLARAYLRRWRRGVLSIVPALRDARLVRQARTENEEHLAVFHPVREKRGEILS